jgi:hypothetical protein
VGTSVAAGTAATVGAVALDVGILATSVGTVGSVVGTIADMQEADYRREMAEFQAQQAEENSRLSLRRAETMELDANQKRAALLDKYQQQRGAGRAGYAAAGVVLGSGTSAEYEADLANVYDLDSRNLDYDVASNAWKSRVEGIDYANQAKMYRAQAEAYDSSKGLTLLSGGIGAAGTALGGAINLMSSVGGLASKGASSGGGWFSKAVDSMFDKMG